MLGFMRGFLAGIVMAGCFAVVARGQVEVVTAAVSYAHPAAGLVERCAEERDVLLRFLSVYPAPAAWTFYVVCDEESWERLVRGEVGAGTVAAGLAVYGETSLARGITVIRGEKLIAPDERCMPEEIVAHELAHIYLRSHDEDAVRELAAEWMRR